MLKEAGWALDKPEDREYEVAGMPNSHNKGFVDYVVRLVLGSPTGGPEQFVRTTHSLELETEDAVLAYEAMYEQNNQAASHVFDTRQVLFGDVHAAIAPCGFRLHWIEESWVKMWRGFLPYGTPLNDPMPMPQETREEILALREGLLKTLPLKS